MLYQRLQAAGVEFIEGIQEQPWGQRAMRLYDLDGAHPRNRGTDGCHRTAVLWAGLVDLKRVAAKTGMPHEFIAGAIKERA